MDKEEKSNLERRFKGAYVKMNRIAGIVESGCQESDRGQNTHDDDQS